MSFQSSSPPQSRRCPYCDVAWPRKYLTCPVCRETTEVSATAPVSPEAAEERARQAGFGWYLYDNGLL